MSNWAPAVVDWLMTPLSGSEHHHISAAVAWHARCMVAGWNILLPLGMLIARFLKIPRLAVWPARIDDQSWWIGHVGLQISGTLLALIGLYLALGIPQQATPSPAVTWHHWLGWTVMGIAAIQISGGMLRGSKGGPTDPRSLRGDHYDMTIRRRLFEHVHKSLGWLSLPPVWAATAIGLVMADAPRWMPIVLILWWVGFIGVFIRLQLAGRCVDTYHAIWGDSPDHPGNARRPIGIGVRAHPLMQRSADRLTG